jgi:ParB family chromosome partitioning protein
MTEVASVSPIRRETTPRMRIDDIRVVDRHRRDCGDIDSLAASISEVTLLQPIVVTREGRLVAGQRRLEACKQLGWKAIPVAYAENLTDAVSLLKAERDENVERKQMTPSELVALGRALEEIERPKAKARQGTRTDLGAELLHTDTQKFRSAADAVGHALGISESNYTRAKALVTAAEAGDEKAAEAVTEMDRTGKITPVYNRYKGRPSAPSGGSEQRSEPEPAMRNKSREAVEERRAQIRELAERGYSSSQIAAKLGYASPDTLRAAAKTAGIEIPADKVMGRTRKKVDQNRLISETVYGLEGTVMALEFLDVTQIEDLSEIEYWVTSISSSLRDLNRLLLKPLKEMTQ